jgi:hypothetical protein
LCHRLRQAPLLLAESPRNVTGALPQIAGNAGSDAIEWSPSIATEGEYRSAELLTDPRVLTLHSNRCPMWQAYLREWGVDRWRAESRPRAMKRGKCTWSARWERFAASSPPHSPRRGGLPLRRASRGDGRATPANVPCAPGRSARVASGANSRLRVLNQCDR